MTILDSFFRIGFGNRNDTPEPKLITEDFDSFRNSFTYADSLSQWADNLVGVGLFEFVVAHILTDEIVDVLFFFQRGQRLGGTNQLGNAGGEGFLVLLDLVFFKQVFRNQLHMVGTGIEAVGKGGHIEDLGTVQPQLEENFR